MSQPNYFVPNASVIVDIIKNTYNTTIITEQPHGYGVGLQVRIIIPIERGMQQLNNTIASVVNPTNNTFQINVPSIGFDDFNPTTVLPLSSYKYLAQVIPVSEDGLTLKYATINNGTAKPYVSKPIVPHGGII